MKNFIKLVRAITGLIFAITVFLAVMFLLGWLLR